LGKSIDATLSFCISGGSGITGTNKLEVVLPVSSVPVSGVSSSESGVASTVPENVREEPVS